MCMLQCIISIYPQHPEAGIARDIALWRDLGGGTTHAEKVTEGPNLQQRHQLSYSEIAPGFGPQTKEQSKKSQTSQMAVASKPKHRKGRNLQVLKVCHSNKSNVWNYMQNIHRNSDDIDKDIQKQVHDYAETKGLNILSAFIIHNKFRSDAQYEYQSDKKIMH